MIYYLVSTNLVLVAELLGLLLIAADRQDTCHEGNVSMGTALVMSCLFTQQCINPPCTGLRKLIEALTVSYTFCKVYDKKYGIWQYGIYGKNAGSV